MLYIFEAFHASENSLLFNIFYKINMLTIKQLFMRKCFFQSSYLLKEAKSIHLTNLHSVCE